MLMRSYDSYGFVQLLYETMIDHMGSFQTNEEDFMTFKVLI